MSKGTRREQQCCEIFENAGYMTYRPATVRFGENDVFGLFDLVAMKTDAPPWYVQVKSNGAYGIEAWCEKVREIFPFEHGRAAYAVPYDQYGWRLIRVGSTDRCTVYDERDTDDNMGEGITNYLREKAESEQ